MPTFSYKARDSAGNAVDGCIEAPDTRTAAGKIREMGYWPVEVRERGEKIKGPQNFAANAISAIWTGVSVRSLAVFFRQLATMLEAGMTLSQALDSLGRQRGMGRLSGISRKAALHVRGGGRLSEFLGRYPNVFSRVQLALIAAGEAGGMMDQMIGRIASYLERELELRQKFSRTTFYPKLLLIAILVIPQVPALILGGPDASVRFVRNIATLALWIAAAYVALRILLAFPPARSAWDMVKISVPVLGAAVRKLAMSRFSIALSAMYTAGLSVSEAVELSADAAGNTVLARAIRSRCNDLRRGGRLSDVLRGSGVVPHLVVSMVQTGEQTGNLDLTLDKVSEYYESEAATTLEKSGYFLFVLLIVGAGLMVGIIVLGGYQQYLGHLGLH